MPLDLSCTNEQKIKCTATPTTAAGNPATLDGPMVISVVSGEGTFTQDPAEPSRFYVVSGANPGDTSYLVEADAEHFELGQVQLVELRPGLG